ncbi:MAG: type II toxin-antitoxin system VapC family toxin [Candidatus Hatepunaea meridiana]|nr:type II toxin-antitoxin system VapC family toxin [Candidatus Hatepunaea meridiana]
MIDTNIWFYVYGPQLPKDWKSNVYSRALAEMCSVGSEMIIDVLIISEFINRYSRYEFESQKENIGINQFKEFRGSSHFMEVINAIADTTRRILTQSIRIGSGFELLKEEAIISDYQKSAQKHDFNDQILIELCRTRNLVLITHDSDFKNCGIKVLTANRKLLSSV